MQFTVKFERSCAAKFGERLAESNARLARLGFPKIEIIETSTFEEDRKDRLGFKYIVEMNEAVLSGPNFVGLSGVIYVGSIFERDGVQQVFSDDPVFFERVQGNLRCDHCNSKRRRKTYHVFRKDGVEVMIGSTCSAEYFGIDIERYLHVYQAAVKEISYVDEADGTNAAPSALTLNEVIVLTYLATNKFRSWTRKDASAVDGNMGTVDRVKILALNSSGRHADPDIAKAVKEAVSMLIPQMDTLRSKVEAAIRNLEIRTNFDYNARNVLLDDLTGRVMNAISVQHGVGVASFFVFKTLKEEDKTVGGIERNNTHVGEVGEKWVGKLTVERVTSFDGNYGTVYVVTMRDETGHCLVTKTSSGVGDWEVGKTYEAKGTIKAHDEFRGTKQTILTRLKGTVAV